MKKVLGLNATQWVALGVLLTGAAFAFDWYRAPDPIVKRLDDQGRKIDALLDWAYYLSKDRGWPTPHVPERAASAEPQTEPPAGGPYAAVLDVPRGDCP